MQSRHSETGYNQRLRKWFVSPLGRSLQAVEINCLRGVFTRLYGPVAVQVGSVCGVNMVEATLAATRIVLEQTPLDNGDGPQVQAHPEALPFDGKAVHLAVLPHTLEFSSDPHQVLREVNRVLLPEGHVVVIGFNPFSLWGLWRLFKRFGNDMPWCCRFFSLNRVKDWLSVLGFELVGGEMLYYRPPFVREATRDRLFFMEKAGNRWWPMLGAAYILVARKRELGMTPLQPAWRKRNPKARGLAEPVTRGM
jgi:ubiquinone/menaquinone biosynthesis C-methylase UbiE